MAQNWNTTPCIQGRTFNFHGSLFVLLALLAVLAILLIPGQNARADTLLVDTLIDSNSAAYRACTGAANDCSLRGAIARAAELAGMDTITLPSGTYLLTLGRLEIDSSLSLVGDGYQTTIIDGNLESRVMVVYGGNSPTVSISGVTLRNGRGGASQPGAGLSVADGAYVTLSRSLVHNNRTNAPGGGISNSGTLILVDSTVRDNHIPIEGQGDVGGVQHSGGGLMNYSDATMRIIRSTIEGNSATRGGGIRNAGGHLEVINSTISGNYALARGGGLMNFGTAWIAFSTITDNETDGMADSPDDPSGGGGIYNDPGVDADGFTVARVSIGNSIVAENRDNRGDEDEEYTPDCLSIDPSRFTSFRGNLIGIANSYCNLADTIYGTDASFDQYGFEAFPLDPWLLPLADNGGWTETHEIQTVSPALDEGTGVTSADFFDCPETDQRGVERPQGEDCDVGAFEIEQRFVPLGIGFTQDEPNIPLPDPRMVVVMYSTPDFPSYSSLLWSSLTFGVTGEEDSLLRFPGSQQPACTIADADRDGLPDLVCKFDTLTAGFACGDTQAILQAELNDGSLAYSALAVTVGPCP